MTLVSKDEDINLSAMAGHLHQIAEDAIKNEIEKVCKKHGFDAAYWDFNLKLEFSSLDTSSFKPWKTVYVTKISHEDEEISENSGKEIE